jgi:hypothetical protein
MAIYGDFEPIMHVNNIRAYQFKNQTKPPQRPAFSLKTNDA